MRTTEATTLSLRELEEFDPHAPPARGDERRFCCPLPGPCTGKRIDADHRCLIANMRSGAWNCKRCGSAGKLREFWDEREPRTPRTRRPLRRVEFTGTVTLPDTTPAPPSPEARQPRASGAADDWRQQLRHLQPLAGTPGEEYLRGRGIPLDVAAAAGVKFSTAFYGRPAVVFPLRDRDENLVAAEGRFTDGRKQKAQSAGRKAGGTFAPPGAWDAEPLIICEGPMDALSLAACGFPAVALCGSSLSDAAAWRCALRKVAVALDADDAGDKAAQKLGRVLRSERGAKTLRLRPSLKDWNDELQACGADKLRAELSRLLAPAPDVPPLPNVSSREDSGAPAPADGNDYQAPPPTDEDAPPPDPAADLRAVGDMTIAEFNAAGRVLRVWSETLQEEVLLAADNADVPDPAGRVVYRAAEFAALLRITDPDALRLIHETKRVFTGTLQP